MSNNLTVADEYDNMQIMKTYNTQRKWSDAYIPVVNTILRQAIAMDASDSIEITSDEVDMKEAADLSIIGAGYDIRIALRLREAAYANAYPYDFTIRYQYADGYKTEFAKIEEGKADLMFYGFTDNGKIIRWLILDLDALRLEINEPHVKYEQKGNRDGRNSFRAYDIRSFKRDDLIVAKSKGFFDLKQRTVIGANGLHITIGDFK